MQFSERLRRVFEQRSRRRRRERQQLRSQMAIIETLEVRTLLAAAVEPLGSLVYREVITGSISTPSELDTFTVDLDVGQTLSVSAQSTSGPLLPALLVQDPSLVNVASDVELINNVQITTPGTWSISISDLFFSDTGDYTLQYVINGAIEAESFGGAENNSTGTAQDIEPSSITVGTAARRAVTGIAQAATDDFFSFSVGSSSVTSLALASAGTVTLSLLDPTGNLIAAGVNAANAAQVINNYIKQTGGTETLFAQVGSDADDTEYTLVVTDGADFDTEGNSSIDDAQPLSLTNGLGPHKAIGHVSDGGSSNQFDTPILNFDAQGYNFVQPPDPSGDVGIDYFIQAINAPGGAQVTIYNKSDGSIAQGPFLMDTLATSGPGTDGLGDPIVLYDHLADRWLLTEFSGSANGLSVFVSMTDDPTDNQWHHEFFPTTQFPDYPKFSVWPDGYYVSSNEGGGSPVYVLDRDALLAGTTPRPIQRFTAPSLAGFGFQALTPADLDGPAPPTDAPALYMRHRDDEVHNAGSNNPTQDFLEVWAFDADLDNAANSTFQQIATIPIDEFDSDLNGLFAFEAFPQPNGVLLDPLREVIMNRLQYRNFGTHEVLVGNFVTDVDGTDHGGVRWFELRRTGGTSGTWTLHQEGTVAPDSHNRFMGGIAMDGQGNIALAYNIVSPTLEAGLRYTGRLASDPLGTMPQGEHVLVNGIGSNGSNRWGDYSQMGVDPVDDLTFWFTGEYADQPLGGWDTRIGAIQLQPATDVDYYEFEVQAFDSLSIETSTPFDAPLNVPNTLDPIIELFDPTGASVASDDNSAADGRNASLTHFATMTGTYTLRVAATGGTEGTYVVDTALIASVDSPGPFVTDTTPFDGGTVPIFPTTLTVNFSESIDARLVSAADLVVGGLPSVAVSQVDGDTFTFTLDPAADVGDGTYAVSLAAGEVQDLQGVDNDAYAGTFIVDTAGPRLTSLLLNGAPLPVDRSIAPGPLQLTANFDEALKIFIRARGGLRAPRLEAVELVNTLTGETFSPTVLNANTNHDQITIDFDPLPEGPYTLTFISGDEDFEDAAGNDLDGEPLGPGIDGTPTGDGSAGGNYSLNFFIDDSSPSLEPFERVSPLGSLVSISTGTLGTLHDDTDADEFQFFAQAGETIAAGLIPDDPGATVAVEIVGMTLPVFSPAPGEEAVLPVQTIPADGFYTVRVFADMGTAFELDLFRNTTLEDLVGDAGDGNELDITDSFVPLGSGRFAVEGAVDNLSFGALTTVTQNNPFPSLFIDISGTGTPLGLGDDGEATINTTVGNSLFPAGAVTVGNNGGIMEGAGLELTYSNGALPQGIYDAALFPFWDDLYPGTDDVYWEERIVDGVNTLIVQWDSVEHFDVAAPITFQLQLFENGPILARFAYEDVDFGNASYNGGASATIGVQQNSTTALQFSMNTASVANGDVIDFLFPPVGTDVDEYTINLSAKVGEPIDVILDGLDAVDFSGETLELLDVDGTSVLATATAGAANFDLGILDFVVPVAGVYTIRVTSTDLAGDYSVMVTDPLTFDTEPNNNIGDPLRSLDVTREALGYLDGTDVADLYQLSLYAGQTVQVSTRTPFDDPQRDPLNDLDPSLTITHPNQSDTVATDQDSADGRNAVVSFTAPVSGVYTIAVDRQTGAGEYVVQVQANARIIDDGDPGFAIENGTWGTGNAGALGDNRNASTSGNKVASWTFLNLLPGQYRVAATWVGNAARASDAPFTVFDGTNPLATVDVNQKVAPTGSPQINDLGVAWQDLGKLFSITGNTLVVKLTNNANGFVMADAVRIERVADLPRVIDDGDPGFAIETGSWGTGNVGALGDNRNASKFGGTKVARWSFTNLTPGQYRISATWSPSGVRATDAPYTIFDGGSMIKTVDVNQQLAPSGSPELVDLGVLWQDLGGLVNITGNTLHVKLTNVANGYVMADAIRIERVADLPVIIDDGDPGFAIETGAWGTGNSGANGDNRNASTSGGLKVARWAFTGLASGQYRVYATWTSSPVRATDAPFTIFDGTNVLSTIDVNQQAAPSGSPQIDDLGVSWQLLGDMFTITGDTLIVKLSNVANGYVMADAIRIERIGP